MIAASSDCIPRRAGESGMTLIELLVVMAIIAVLTTLLVPAAQQILKGSSLTQSGDQVSNLLTLARQSALTKNCSVEVRFYRYADTSLPGETGADPSTWKYRAVQTFTVDGAGACAPLGKVEGLTGAVILDSGSELSPLLGSTLVRSLPTPPPQIPRAGTSYTCCAFRFLSDGSTNLSISAGPWFVTLHNLTDGDGLTAADVGSSARVKNYVSMQIDPVNGALSVYRP